MARKKKSPQKANDVENKRYPLRRKIDAAKGLEQKTGKVTTSSVTVAAKDPAQKKTISATTLNTVTPAGPARNIRSDTSLVSIDTTCPVVTPATTNDARRALENTVASVVTRIAEKTVEYRELREAVDIINGKMDTVMDTMARESIQLQENKKEVGNIKKELQNQREDFNEMKSTLADLGFVMKRAVELLERKEQNNTMATSVLEMSTVESENIFVDSNNEEMNGSVLEDEEKLLSDTRLSTIIEESTILNQQSKNTIDTVTRRDTFSSERTDPTVTNRTSLATERSTTVTHRTSLPMERTDPTATRRNSFSTERTDPTVTRRTIFSTGRDNLSSEFSTMTIMDESQFIGQDGPIEASPLVDKVTRRDTFSSERTDPTVTYRTSLATERTTPTVTHRTSLSTERSTPTVTHQSSLATERSTPTVTRRTIFSTGRDNLSSEFSTMTIMDESQFIGQDGPIEASPLLSSLKTEEDSGRIKKQFNRLTCAPSSLINTPIGSEGERREGSLASLLCDSIRRRGSSLATSRLSDLTGESPVSGRLTVSNGEVSEQMTSETRARRSSMDLARHILEKRISTRLTNDDSVVIQNTTPAIRNHKTPDSVICLGTPYRPTPPLINLVTSNNEATPRRTTSFRAHSSAMFDDSMNLQSARDALRRTNNGTAPRDILNTTMRSDDSNTSARNSDI